MARTYHRLSPTLDPPAAEARDPLKPTPDLGRNTNLIAELITIQSPERAALDLTERLNTDATTPDAGRGPAGPARRDPTLPTPPHPPSP